MLPSLSPNTQTGELVQEALFTHGEYRETSRLQHHKTVDIGKDLWRLRSPTPLLKAGSTRSCAQDHVQSDFDCFQGRRINSHGQSVLAFGHIFCLHGCSCV